MRQIVAAYESVSNRTLSQSDPVYLFLHSIALIIAHQRTLIDIAAKNNLLAYAEGSYLDHIGALLGVSRLDGEDDESLRERIRIAPESFSVAGPAKAYEFHARKAHPDIADVKILTPPDTEPGHVEIYPLMKGGAMPDDSVLEAVRNICAADTVRPDTDYVTVKKPSAVTFTLNIDYWIDAGNSAVAVSLKQNIEQAIETWLVWQKSSLGRDINPSELTHRVIQAGAKRCVIHSPVFTVLKNSQTASCSQKLINYMGLEES